MNILDVIVVVFIALCVLVAYHRGLIKSVFNLVSWVVSIFLANYLYPVVSKIIRMTTLYTSIKQSITDSLGLNVAITEATSKAQADLIDSVFVPDFIKRALLYNNNIEVYRILDVASIEDYIAGYIANIFINIISIILVFCLVFILMRILASALDLIAKLPVINTFNNIGGAIAGLLNAVIIIWIIMAVFTFFTYGENYAQAAALINGSKIAKWFYETNMILQLIIRIVA